MLCKIDCNQSDSSRRKSRKWQIEGIFLNIPFNPYILR